MDGDLGTWVRGQIAKANIIAMDKIWDNGYRQTTSSTRADRDARGLQELQDPRAVSPLWTSMFKAFDAAPTSINLNETYSALQTKIVEGQENPLAVISTTKFWEVQKYCSLTNHMWDGYWFLANRRAPSRSSRRTCADGRQAHQRRRHEGARGRRQLNASLQDELTKNGLTFNKPDPEPFPGEAAQGRLLLRMEGAATARRLVDPREVHRKLA